MSNVTEHVDKLIELIQNSTSFLGIGSIHKKSIVLLFNSKNQGENIIKDEF